MAALNARLASAHAHAERLSSERDKLLEISNRLRAELNLSAARAEGGAGSERAAAAPPAPRDQSQRVDALEQAMAALAAQNGQALREHAPTRAAPREQAGAADSGVELLHAEPSESARASLLSVGSFRSAVRSSLGAGTDISLAGSASHLAGRPGSASASDRETVSQQTARARELQRQRAEASRKRSLVPNYAQLAASADPQRASIE